jgi:hypothetical protein
MSGQWVTPEMAAPASGAGRLGRSRSSMSHLGGPRSKNGHTRSIGKSNRNRLDAARLVCMTEVSDLPNPVAGCRRLAGMPMLRRNVFGMGLGSALDQRTWRLELVQSCRSAKR